MLEYPISMQEKLKTIKDHPFVKYTWVGGLFSVLNVVLLWIFIDALHIPTLISSTIVVGGLFVGKYFFYRYTGLVG